MAGYDDPYTVFSQSAGNKKFVSATAVADWGNSQAIVRQPARSTLNAFTIGGARWYNRTGLGAYLGLAVRFPLAHWWAGQVTAAGVYTDATADAQNSTTGDFPLHDRAASGSGCIVSASERFNIVGIIYTTAGDQTTPVLLVEYWNGTAWVDMNATDGAMIVADALNGATLEEKLLTWALPPDWALGGTGTGLSQSRYHIRIRQTHSGAGTVDPLAAQLFVGYAHMQSGGVELLATDYGVRYPQIGDALYPVFSAPAAANMIEVAVRFS